MKYGGNTFLKLGDRFPKFGKYGEEAGGTAGVL